MNNITGHNYGDIANTISLSPFGKNQQNLKKKNSVKMAARSRRISPQSSVNNQYEHNQQTQPYNATITPFNIQPVINDPHDYMSYNVFSPTAPDPFTSFGPVPINFCYSDIGLEDAYSANNIQFGRYEGCPPENKQNFKMPEFLKQTKDKEEENKYKKQTNVAQNINGKPQK